MAIHVAFVSSFFHNRIELDRVFHAIEAFARVLRGIGDRSFDRFDADPTANSLTQFQAEANSVLRSDSIRGALDLFEETDVLKVKYGGGSQLGRNVHSLQAEVLQAKSPSEKPTSKDNDLFQMHARPAICVQRFCIC